MKKLFYEDLNSIVGGKKFVFRVGRYMGSWLVSRIFYDDNNWISDLYSYPNLFSTREEATIFMRRMINDINITSEFVGVDIIIDEPTL